MVSPHFPTHSGNTPASPDASVAVVTRQTTDPDATEALGQGLASLLRSGDVVLLDGPLGAGKTALTRGIAAGLGIKTGVVSSPTFVVMNVYSISPTPGVQGSISQPAELVHIDAYRTAGDEELANIGWDHVFDPTTNRPRRGIAVVEWPTKLLTSLPNPVSCVNITLAHAGEHDRTIAITFPQAYWAPRLQDAGYANLLEGFTLRPPIRCPRTGAWVSPTNPAYPFIDTRQQNADLFRWLVPPTDTEEDEDDSISDAPSTR
jgi:tRNA threonylcarbamoyladenosine biosynthesis protein TsaE